MRNNTGNRHKGIRILFTVVTTAAVAVVFAAAVLNIQGNQQPTATSSGGVLVTGKTSLPKTAANVGGTQKSSATPSAQKPQVKVVSPSAKTAPKKAPEKPAGVSPDVFKGDVFMGDSVTVGLMMYNESAKAAVVGSIGASSYRALTCHSVAINGNKKDVGYLPDRVAAAHPKKVFMMFGSNDLEWGTQMPAKKFIGYYGKLIDAVHGRCPKATIYIQSILPITKAVQNTKAYPFDNKRVDQFNAAVKALCKTRGLSYLDVASVIKGPDGCMPANESDDGLHPRTKGYKAWFAYLATHA
jgi:lysophospholipase L1-like esterase